MQRRRSSEAIVVDNGQESRNRTSGLSSQRDGIVNLNVFESMEVKT